MVAFMPPSEPVTLETCTSPGLFLRSQARFYRGDPCFVPPLYLMDRKKVDLRRNPFFEHGEGILMLARRRGEIVGRISAARDRLHDEFHGDRMGTFGHFEAVDAESAGCLLDAACTWLREHGASHARGPIDFSTNYRCGLLIGGEPGAPYVMMPYNPPRYAEWIEGKGFAKAKDLVALLLTADRLQMERMHRLDSRIRERTPLRTRQLDLKRFSDEIDLLWRLYNRIWERNWGFVPMSQAEFVAEAKDLKSIVDPHLTVIIERESDGAPIAFAIGVPDVNRAVAACKGHLLPFGWIRFLTTLRRTKCFRTITLGILPEVRGTGIDAVLLRQLIVQGLAAGYPECEASWILEDNHAMLRALLAAGGHEYRRYRIYERPLT